MKKSFWQVKDCYQLTQGEKEFIEETNEKGSMNYKLSQKEKETIDKIWYRLFSSVTQKYGDKILKLSEKKWFGGGPVLTLHYKKLHALHWMRTWGQRSDKEMAEFLMGAMQNHVQAYQELISIVYKQIIYDEL
jgi:hypothetical protein